MVIVRWLNEKIIFLIILNQNNDSKIIMIMNVLNGKQKLPYEKYLASQIVSDDLKD